MKVRNDTVMSSDYIEFEAMIVNRQGQYAKGRIKGKSEWVCLLVGRTASEQAYIDAEIDMAVQRWHLAGKESHYIVVPSHLFVAQRTRPLCPAQVH